MLSVSYERKQNRRERWFFVGRLRLYSWQPCWQCQLVLTDDVDWSESPGLIRSSSSDWLRLSMFRATCCAFWTEAGICMRCTAGDPPTVADLSFWSRNKTIWRACLTLFRRACPNIYKHYVYDKKKCLFKIVMPPCFYILILTLTNCVSCCTWLFACSNLVCVALIAVWLWLANAWSCSWATWSNSATVFCSWPFFFCSSLANFDWKQINSYQWLSVQLGLHHTVVYTWPPKFGFVCLQFYLFLNFFR